MDLVGLKKQIKDGELSRFYVFTGLELELQSIYINQMGEHITRVNTVSEVYNKITSRLISGGSEDVVYVVRDDKDFISKEKAYTNIGNRIKNGRLILCLTDINKQSKFYNMYKDEIVEFHHMTTPQLYPIVSKMIGGRENIIKYFIERCDNDYSTILNNIDKIENLGIQELSKDIIDDLVYQRDTVDVFKLVDKIISLDRVQALRDLDVLLNDEGNELGFLSLLYKRINHCILVEGYRGSKNIGKDTELSGWECRNILELNKIKPSNLLYALRIIQKYDSGIKSGKFEPRHGVWCAIVEILSL